jgi:hypothetical protein
MFVWGLFEQQSYFLSGIIVYQKKFFQLKIIRVVNYKRLGSL